MQRQAIPQRSQKGPGGPARAFALLAALCFFHSSLAQANPTIEAARGPERAEKHGAGPPASKAPDRVGFAIQFTGVPKLDEDTLRVMMVRRAESIRARVKRIAATDAQDFWVQAKVEKRPDEDGNIGFDLRLVGRFQGRSLRWPELGRRCTFCTDGEFVEMFAEAFAALMARPMPQVHHDGRATHSSAAAKSQPLAQKASSQSQGAKPLALSSDKMWPENIVKDDRQSTAAMAQKPRSLRWWGWMGLGLSTAGASSIVASLVTMPRNVPMPGNPAQMYPFRPDAATKIGLAVGGSCLVAGVALWVTDLVMRARKGRARAPSMARRAWSF